MKPEEIEQIKKLIELKKAEEKAKLNNEIFNQQTLLMKLQKDFLEFSKLNSEEMQKLLDKKIEPKTINVEQASNVNSMVEDYRKKYSKEKWYKEPVVEGNKTKLTFPSQEEAANFMLDQAKKGQDFIVVDGKTQKVIAYSNGDGHLYNGDGKEFKPGDPFVPSQHSPEDIDLSPKQMKHGK